MLPGGGCMVLSVARAAILLSTSTVVEPVTMKFGGGVAQVSLSVARAWARLSVSTVVEHGGAIGPGGGACGFGPGSTVVHACLSDTRAAGGMVNLLPIPGHLLDL
jgi:hypothetical protein